MFDENYEDSEGNFLWNGHEYYFTVGKARYTGVYKKSRCSFFDRDTGGKICGVGEAVDIKNTIPSTTD